MVSASVTRLGLYLTYLNWKELSYLRYNQWENAPLNKVRKLGLLAGTFEDGSMSIFAIPDPEDLQSSANNGPIYGLYLQSSRYLASYTDRLTQLKLVRYCGSPQRRHLSGVSIGQTANEQLWAAQMVNSISAVYQQTCNLLFYQALWLSMISSMH